MLRKFGYGNSSLEMGYDLSLLLGHFEALVSTEQENTTSTKGLKMKRLELAEDILDKLYQMSQWEPEE